jgi:hypothetical protein
MDKLSIMEQLCFSTTRIETKDLNGNGYSGTGFFFRLEFDGNRIVPLVVTNKHVVRGMTTGMFRLTKADANGNPIHKDHFQIQIDQFEQSWLFHPDNEVDLCVLPVANIINIARAHGVSLFYRTFDETLIPNKEKLETLDAVEEILMIGYPNGLWDSVNNMPIVRKGITATDIKFDYEGRKEFLIDAACFPGSSGSPVLICNVGGYRDKQGNLNWGSSRIFLLGILYAGPQLTVTGDIKVVTIPNMQQKALAVSHIPNNLGYIIKAERIMDFVPLIKQKFNL